MTTRPSSRELERTGEAAYQHAYYLRNPEKWERLRQQRLAAGVEASRARGMPPDYEQQKALAQAEVDAVLQRVEQDRAALRRLLAGAPGELVRT